MRQDSEKLKQAIKHRNVRASQSISKDDIKEIRRCLTTRQNLLENLVSTVSESAATAHVVEQLRSKEK